MHNLKRMLAVILAVVLIVPTVNIKVNAEDEVAANTITILHTNDVHCGGISEEGDGASGYAKLAAYKKSLKSQAGTAGVILVDAGDHIQGETIGTLTKGEDVIGIMNAVGYDVATPGNHEFDFEMSTFIARKTQATFPYVSANFMDLATNKTVLDQYKIVEVSGKKIAFVGISTPETYTKSTPKYFQNDKGEYIYSFSEKNFYETIQSGIDAAKTAGADLVVALAHTGITGSATEWNSESIIANTTGIDLFIDGHSHDELIGSYNSKDNKSVPYAQTGTKLKNIGRVDITIGEEGALTINTPVSVATSELTDLDTDVKALLDAANTKVAEFAGEKVGSSEVDLYAKTNNGTGDRITNQETQLGNFIADAYKWKTGADIGIINSGGIRDSIKTGDLIANDLIKVNPWMNSIGVIEATGQTILDALEHGARTAPNAENGFLQVSGITYEVNTKIPTPVVVESDKTFSKITEGAERRVKNVYVGGKEIDPNKTYTIGSTLYILQNSGDGYSMFANCKLKTGTEFPSDAQILIDYVKNELKGKITAEKYGKTEGRIRVYRDNTIPVYRLYNPSSGEHLFTSKEGEYNKLGKIGWVKEGRAFDAYTTDDAPSNAVFLYRLFNKNGFGGLGDHHYTTKQSEVDKLAKLGWQVDNNGKPMYYTTGEYEVYRLYNKRSGAHHYTPKRSEHDKLVKLGWTSEGLGWKSYGYYFTSTHIVNPKDTNIALLHTNDVHCGGIDGSENAVAPFGYAKLAAKKKQVASESGVDKVILADAGDHIQGETIGTITKGSAIIDIMNAIGYDVATPGNHEFDYQMSTFNQRREQAKFPYVSANFYDLATNKPALDQYKIINVSGYKVAFVGISTPETYTKSTPKYFQDETGKYIYSFKEDDFYNTIQSGIDAAKTAGADTVIALAHTGMTGSATEWNSESIIANTTGIDLYIDGHSHDALITTYTSKDGKTVPYAQTGTKLANIGRVDIKFDVTGNLVINTPVSIETKTLTDMDSDVKALLDAANKQVVDFAGEKVGTSEVDLYAKTDNGTGNRISTEETQIGNFIADAYRWKTGAAIGIINSGGIRDNIKSGELTANDLIKVNPWMNDVGVIEATGQTILDALEHSVRNLPESENGFLQVSGITFDVDLSVPSPVILGSNNEYAGITEGAARRIKNVKVGAVDLNPEMTYTIGSTLYILQNSGDGYTMFANCKLKTGSQYVFPTDAEILIDYLKNELKGKITTEKYGKKEGRINILTAQ